MIVVIVLTLVNDNKPGRAGRDNDNNVREGGGGGESQRSAAHNYLSNNALNANFDFNDSELNSYDNLSKEQSKQCHAYTAECKMGAKMVRLYRSQLCQTHDHTSRALSVPSSD
jgi:hypothetical protein